jgi:DNA repair protein RecO (recombination protein O)
MERTADRAVVLSCVDYGEADRVVTLFCERRGKVAAFAAGARKSRRRFAGALEPGTLLRVLLVERRGSTERLDAAEIERAFQGLRQELPLIARGLYTLELCRELVRDHEPHPQLFAALIGYLDLLDRRRAGPTSLIAFELEALAHAGLMPRFDVCTLCGRPAGELARFDPSHGGLVCAACQSRAPGAVPIAAPLALALRAIQAGGRAPMPAEQRARARELLNLFIAHHLGRRLRSVDFLTQVGVD